MSRFSINELIYTINQKREITGKDNTKKQSYSEVLGRIQQLISQNHSAELAEILYSNESEMRLKSLIVRYLNQNRLAVDGVSNISELADKIFNDMAGIGLLTEYLKDPEIEEININGYNGIWVQYKDKTEVIPYNFNSPLDCLNIVKKMSRFGGVILDGSKPIGDSFIAKGIRMSGAIAPCVDGSVGAIASIRKQRPAYITKENLIKWGTATEQQLDFLVTCINNGVSLALTGATSSGKTSDMGYLLSNIDDRKRVVTIEDTKELNLAKFDEKGIMTNDVVQLMTREEPNPVTMLDLLKLSLRLHPEILVPAEMRGGEALTVQEAGRTGHTIVTTLHANNAITAYERILTMCQMADTRLTEERLLKNIIEAFPVMVHKKRLADGSRKYMEIYEATDVVGGKVVGNMIYQFVIDHYERDENGRIIKVHGEHKKVGNISKTLALRLFENGVMLDDVRKFAGNDFVPFETDKSEVDSI